MAHSVKTKTKCPNCDNVWWIYCSFAGIAECSLCGHERKYNPRKTNKGITKAQVKALHRIRNHFVDWNKIVAFERFEVELRESGSLYFNVKTAGNVFISEGCSGLIGSGGKIEVMTASGLSQVHDKAFYQVWLKRASGCVDMEIV